MPDRTAAQTAKNHDNEYAMRPFRQKGIAKQPVSNHKTACLGVQNGTSCKAKSMLSQVRVNQTITPQALFGNKSLHMAARSNTAWEYQPRQLNFSLKMQ